MAQDGSYQDAGPPDDGFAAAYLGIDFDAVAINHLLLLLSIFYKVSRSRQYLLRRSVAGVAPNEASNAD